MSLRLIKNLMSIMAVSALFFSISASAADGEAVYKKTCKMCHDSGIMGAPKISDKAAWAESLAKGQAVLEDHAINGFQGSRGKMPARGGNPKLTDEEVKAAVAYILEQTK